MPSLGGGVTGLTATGQMSDSFYQTFPYQSPSSVQTFVSSSNPFPVLPTLTALTFNSSAPGFAGGAIDNSNDLLLRILIKLDGILDVLSTAYGLRPSPSALTNVSDF